MKISAGIVNPIQITSTAQGGQSKVILPVSPTDSFYAQYKYVKGVPANSLQNTVPLKKLELINNMIHSLNHLKEISSRGSESSDSLLYGKESLTLDSLGKELHGRVMKEAPLFANSAASVSATGLAFSLNV